MLNTLTKKILESSDVATLIPDLGKVSLIPQSLARDLQVVAFDGDGKLVRVLTTNTFSEALKETYAWLEKAWYTLNIYYTDETGIATALSWYDRITAQEEAAQQAITQRQEAKGINAIALMRDLWTQRSIMDPGDFLMDMIKFAFQTGASDMHRQSEEAKVILRLRLDGIMQTICDFSHDEYLAYVQKIKFLSGMKMNIDYLPQDGRLSFEVDLADHVHKKIDVRINTMPGTKSENIVLRFLDSAKSVSTFEDIGFRGVGYDALRRGLNKHEGMILVTWPTGSGKTTTLYTILQSLNDGTRTIVTLEDPIEYTIAGIEQSQINHSKGYTFEEWLKAMLRHDPDIVLVGETRNVETAETALNAALTGHLVFSTLHTNSALDTISRLLMMGVKPFLLAPALQVVIAQRLVRKCCPHCLTKRLANEQEKEFITKMLGKIKDARPDLKLARDGNVPHNPGCDHCNNTGYIGRLALLEVMEITEPIREKIVQSASGDTGIIMQYMRANGFLTLLEDGIIKMIAGKTSTEELRRVVG